MISNLKPTKKMIEFARKESDLIISRAEKRKDASQHPFFFSLEFRVLAVPFEEGDGGGVGDVEGACGARDGDVDNHVALG